MKNKQQILDNLTVTLMNLQQLEEKYNIHEAPADYIIISRARRKLYEVYYLIEQKDE